MTSRCKLVVWIILAQDRLSGELWTWSWNCGFHNKQGISWLSEWLIALKEAHINIVVYVEAVFIFLWGWVFTVGWMLYYVHSITKIWFIINLLSTKSVIILVVQMGLIYVFNLIVGTGALILPAVFSRAGWALGLCLICLLAFIR